MKLVQTPGGKLSDGSRYAFALMVAVIATAVRYWLEGPLHFQPFPTYFLGILLVAAVAGAGPAVMTTLLSGVAATLLFIEPRGSLEISEQGDLVRLGVFVVSGFGVAAFAGARSEAYQRVLQAEVKLAEARSREIVDAQLRARETFITGVLDSLPHEITVINASGEVLAVNKRWERFAVENNSTSFPVSVGANYLLVSRAAAEQGDPYAREALEGIAALVKGDRTEFEMEYPCHAPDRERWFALHAARADCAPAAVVISHTDITERKRAVDELRRSEERFASFMRHLPGLAWIKDLNGRYDYATEATLRAFQTTQEQLYGKTDDQVFDAETAAQFRLNDQKALASPKGVISVETLAQDDGLVHHSLVSKFAIRDADAVPCAVGGVAIDITERVQAERQLRLATASLREADKRKDEFLATLAHELRNPLAPIYNALCVLRREAAVSPENERRLKLLDMVERQTAHLIRLVDDLLEVSRITCGKIELRREEIDLVEALRNAIDLASPLLEQRGHKLDVSVPDEPLMVSGDPVRLTQVFANLLNNAANYTQPGGMVTVTATGARDKATVTVQDNGVGISEEMLPRIFELFTQADRPSQTAPGGLGIGLALVRRLVEMHDGAVEARSEGPGKGSVFTVRLPLLPPRHLRAAGEPRSPQKVIGARRILVIDDDHDVADSLVMLIEMLGARVEVAYGGDAGIAKLKEFHPELIFLDLGMPGVDGYETAQRIRALPEGRNVKLIALTGWSENDTLERARSAGFDQKLTKPASFESLQETLIGSSSLSP